MYYVKCEKFYTKYVYSGARGPTKMRFRNWLVVSSIGGNTILLYLQRKI